MGKHTRFAHLEGDDGMVECSCGCEMVREDNDLVRFYMCQKHMAADDLLAACEGLAAFVFSFDKRDQTNGAYRNEVRQLQKNAKAAIAKAKAGKE